MKAYQISRFGLEGLEEVEREKPAPGKGEVLVRIRAVSLNYRDLMMAKGAYDPKLKLPLTPCSDAAGEVVGTGEGVTLWKEGDRVASVFMQGWTEGPIDRAKARTALGGDLEGVLSEFRVFPEQGLVRVPGHLNAREAATLPCAAVTAWNALRYSGGLKKDDTVLLIGTGGVSIFGLQFAKNIGAKTLIISSSDEKLGRADVLGANYLFNYKANPDWDEAALVYTAKRGFDHILEVGGAGTLQRSLNAIRMGGHIALIGVLAAEGDFNPVSILMKAVKVQGIFVGSREMFEDMNRFISENYLKPVVDKVFTFGKSREAFEYLASGKHFGKVVIRV